MKTAYCSRLMLVLFALSGPTFVQGKLQITHSKEAEKNEEMDRKARKAGELPTVEGILKKTIEFKNLETIVGNPVGKNEFEKFEAEIGKLPKGEGGVGDLESYLSSASLENDDKFDTFRKYLEKAGLSPEKLLEEYADQQKEKTLDEYETRDQNGGANTEKIIEYLVKKKAEEEFKGSGIDPKHKLKALESRYGKAYAADFKNLLGKDSDEQKKALAKLSKAGIKDIGVAAALIATGKKDVRESFAAAIKSFEKSELPQTKGYTKYVALQGGEKPVEATGFHTSGATFSVQLDDPNFDYAKKVEEYNSLRATASLTELEKITVKNFEQEAQNKLHAVTEEGYVPFQGVNDAGKFRFMDIRAMGKDSAKVNGIAVPKPLQATFGEKLDGRQYTGFLWTADSNGVAKLEKQEWVDFAETTFLDQVPNSKVPNPPKFSLTWSKTQNRWYLALTDQAGSMSSAPAKFLDARVGNWAQSKTTPIDTSSSISYGQGGFVVGVEGSTTSPRMHVEVVSEAQKDTGAKKTVRAVEVHPVEIPRRSSPGVVGPYTGCASIS